MAIQLSVTARNNSLDSIETTIGTAAKLQIWTGSAPANTAAAATGTKLLEATLPTDWWAAASSGAKALLGTWQSTGLAAGTAGYFRILDNALAAAHIQGTVTATGGGGDMTLDNASIASGQTVTITTFTLADGNA